MANSLITNMKTGLTLLSEKAKIDQVNNKSSHVYQIESGAEPVCQKKFGNGFLRNPLRTVVSLMAISSAGGSTFITTIPSSSDQMSSQGVLQTDCSLAIAEQLGEHLKGIHLALKPSGEDRYNSRVFRKVLSDQCAQNVSSIAIHLQFMAEYEKNNLFTIKHRNSDKVEGIVSQSNQERLCSQENNLLSKIIKVDLSFPKSYRMNDLNGPKISNLLEPINYAIEKRYPSLYPYLLRASHIYFNENKIALEYFIRPSNTFKSNLLAWQWHANCQGIFHTSSRDQSQAKSIGMFALLLSTLAVGILLSKQDGVDDDPPGLAQNPDDQFLALPDVVALRPDSDSEPED